MTATAAPVSPSADDVAERIVSAALGWVETMSIHLGGELGWYDALVAAGPLAPEALAARTSTSPRYAREWLEQQAAYGIVTVSGHDDGSVAPLYSLSPAAAEALTDRGSLAFTAPLARMLAAAAAQMPALVEAYRSGGGVSWEQFGPHARESQAEANRPWLDRMPTVLARQGRIDAVLRRPDARIADIGTGQGWSAIALAKAYPELRVEGFDVDAPSVEAARVHAEQAGVADRVRFHVVDGDALADHGPFDGAVAFECIHDMPDPETVLAAMREATVEDGFVVIMDEAVGEAFTPDAPELDRLMYGFSLFICLPDGLSHASSVGTGTVMRPSTLRRYARNAGFDDVTVLEEGFGFWRFYELRR